MSEFDLTINDEHIECPYCHAKSKSDAEDYTVEQQWVKECDECGMKFHAEQVVMVDYRGDPDCKINSIPHKWESHELKNNKSAEFCSVCGTIRSEWSENN